jgi:hypothetical protein
MQDIGYDTRNVVYAPNTFTFLINLYFIRCGLVILMHVFLKLTKNKFGGRKLYKLLKKGQFYNSLYGMALQGMIEFIINGYLNLKTAEKSSNGETMGFIQSIFCIFTSSSLLPIPIMWLVCSKSKSKLSSEIYEEIIVVLFEGVNLSKNMSILYNLVFWARSIFIIALPLLTA